MTRTRSLPFALLTTAVFVTGGGAQEAQADQIRVGGSVSVRAEGHVRVGTPRVRRSHRAHGRVSHRPVIYVGAQFAEPPPPVQPEPACYQCGAHVHAAPVAVVHGPPPPPPPATPVFGMGIFGGSVDEDGLEAGDVGLFGRLRLSHHLRLEGEVSKAEYTYVDRTDRRLGAALLYDFMPHARLSPYLAAGVGFGRSEASDGRPGADMAYGELGIGLEWRLSDRLSLIGDLRAGSSESHIDEEPVRPLIAESPWISEQADYGRGRIGAILYF